MAGRPALAAMFIKKGASVEEVTNKLLAARAGSDGEEIEQDINADTGTQLRVPRGEAGIVKKCKAMTAQMKGRA